MGFSLESTENLIYVSFSILKGTKHENAFNESYRYGSTRSSHHYCRSACALQMRLDHVGSLVVVDENQTPLGMITDRDIAIEVVARKLNPEQLTVKDIMTSPVVTATPNESMVVALARMREFGVRRLPIVDEQGKLVGVISNSNLVEELSGLLDSLVRNIHSSKTREVALRSE